MQISFTINRKTTKFTKYLGQLIMQEKHQQKSKAHTIVRQKKSSVKNSTTMTDSDCTECERTKSRKRREKLIMRPISRSRTVFDYLEELYKKK